MKGSCVLWFGSLFSVLVSGFVGRMGSTIKGMGDIRVQNEGVSRMGSTIMGMGGIRVQREGRLVVKMSSISLSKRVENALVNRFGNGDDTSRITKCWSSFVAGEKMERYLDAEGEEGEILQSADCYVDGLRAMCFHDASDKSEFPWVESLKDSTSSIYQELVDYEYKRRHNDENENENERYENDFIQSITPTGDGQGGDGGWMGPRDASGEAYGPQWKTLGLQDRSVWDADMQLDFPST